MKTIKIIYFILTCTFLLSLIIGCETDEPIDNLRTIEIVTEKNEYNINETINISITNYLSDTAKYFKCDNHDLRASHIMKNESGVWTEQKLAYRCTAMGPMGFFGDLPPSQSKEDSIKIDSAGTYKLKYTFIIKGDTTNFLSNEFKILN